MDLLVSLSALVKVDRVPENIRLTISHSWKYGSTISHGFWKNIWAPSGPSLVFNSWQRNRKANSSIGRQELLYCILYIVGRVVLRRPIVRALEKKKISFVKDGGQREERKKKENYEQDQ